ncbi:MAG: DUF4239 domain-containing protein [Parachlamydiales bacterium]|nr:DUF4239 domain-containing protein [Parachlamydiales bacterium]
MSLFESPSWIFSALLVVVPTILICSEILILVRKWIPVQDLKANHDVAGFTLGIVGVLYSVILGFTVVNVQSRSNDVAQTIHTEAICIADLYREAAFFNPEGRDAVRKSLRDYVQYVIQKEWGHPKSKKIDLDVQKIMEKIWNSYYQVSLSDEKMKIWYQESIGKLDSFLNARLARQFSSWERLGGMMWTILISGALITICFMYFFGLERLRAHIIMTALVAGYISFMLFLVFSLDNVFHGPQGIQPVAYNEIIELFNEWDNE